MALRLLPNLAAVMLALICGALAEELVFRGYPFQHLVKGHRRRPGRDRLLRHLRRAARSEPLAGNVGASAIPSLIGVLLSIAYLRTRALWLPMGHSFRMESDLGLLFGLPLSGFRNYNLLRYT